MGEIKWWAYLHSNGSIQVKRYFDDDYIKDCDESTFVIDYTKPFEAENRFNAMTIAKRKLGESK